MVLSFLIDFLHNLYRWLFLLIEVIIPLVIQGLFSLFLLLLSVASSTRKHWSIKSCILVTKLSKPLCHEDRKVDLLLHILHVTILCSIVLVLGVDPPKGCGGGGGGGGGGGLYPQDLGY